MDFNDAGYHHRKDFHAWQEARRTHQLEHASEVKPTLSCDVVGHIEFDDEYPGYFGADECRKFCIAMNRPW